MDDLELVASRWESKMQDVLSRIAYSTIETYDRSNVVKLPDNAREDVEATLKQVWLNAIIWKGEPMINEFRSYGFEHLETKSDEMSVFNSVLNFFFDNYAARKVAQILETSRDEILHMVSNGMKEGQTRSEIAKNMRSAVPELSAVRAARITRTETHQASGFAQQAVARQSRRPLMKVWNAVEDGRTRGFTNNAKFSHRQMDGVKVPVGEPYKVPNRDGVPEALMFPGDPNGSPGNVINCRCVETYERSD